MPLPPGTLNLLRERHDWGTARTHLSALAKARRTSVDAKVVGYGSVYAADLGAMVVDVVFSRQRDYVNDVLPAVQTWMAAHPRMTLAQLGAAGPGPIPRLQLHKRADEATTIQEVAAGLSDYCVTRGLTEQTGVRQWADEAEALRYTWRLEPHVGAVRGIGIALFAYLRMRAGADAIKPDVRVRKELIAAGLQLPNDDAAVLLVAEAMAEELGVRRLWFDQLLW